MCFITLFSLFEFEFRVGLSVNRGLNWPIVDGESVQETCLTLILPAILVA